jgi:ABC-type transport system substrate-binding protein
VHVTAGAATENGLRSGQLDYAQVTAPSAEVLGSAPEVTLDRVRMTAPMSFQVCIKDGTPLGSQKVREAISYAIDREAFNDVIYDGVSEPAWDLWPEGSPWHNKDLEGLYERDLDKAKKLVVEAGYPNGVSFNLLAFPTTQRELEVLQAQLKEANINIGIVPTTNPLDYYQLIKEPGVLSQTRPGPLDKITRHFLSNSFSNACKAPFPDVDRKFAELAGLDPQSDDAVTAWHEIQELIIKKLHINPLVTFQVHNVAHSKSKVGEVVYYWDQLGGRQPDPVGTYIKKS